MQFEKFADRLSRLNQLIEEGATGTPEEVARKLGVSKRMLLYYIEYLKDKGAEINYSRSTRTYVFKK